MFVLQDSDDEQRYKCSFHARQSNIPSKNNDSSSYHQTPAVNNRRPLINKRTSSFVVETSLDGTGDHQRRTAERRSIRDEEGPRRTQPVTRGATRNTWTGDRVARSTAASSSSDVETRKLLRRTAVQKGEKTQKSSRQSSAVVRTNADLEMTTESVWITRESLHCTAKDSMRSRQQHQNNIRTNNENCSDHFTKKLRLPIDDDEDGGGAAATAGELHRSGDCFSAARLQQQQQQQPPDPGGGGGGGCCNKAVAMAARKRAIAEWQVMAAIVDRLLFWIFLLATVFTYLVILVGVPLLKSETGEFVPLSSNAMHASDNHLSSRLVTTTSQGQIGHND